MDVGHGTPCPLKSVMFLTRLEKFVFILILAGYVFIAALFALRTPAWQSPDEPAHYNYVRQAASGTLLPVIQPGDWNNDYLNLLKAQRFRPDLLNNLDSIRYENHQPPLYYWLLTPVYFLTGGSLVALRLVSVLFGAGTVFLTYRIGQRIFPAHRALQLAALALVAFLPQHVAILASVNNDALAGLLIAITLYQMLVYLKPVSAMAMADATDTGATDAGGLPPDRVFRSPVTPARLGLLVGLIFVTKTTAYFMAGVVLLALVLRWREIRARDRIPSPEIKNQNRELKPPVQPPVPETRSAQSIISQRSLGKDLTALALPAALFALFWWGRNIAVYGFPDFLGLRAHDAVVVGQLRTADFIAQIGPGEYFQRAIETTFNSFWGQFGWMGVPMNSIPGPGDNFIYPVLLVLCMVAGTGLIVAMRTGQALSLHVASSRNAWLILLAVLFLTLLMYGFYNLTFVQFQGRYLFPAIIPFALLFVSGIEAWRVRLFGRFPRSVWLTVLLMLSFALLDIYLIWRVIPGALAFTSP